MGIHSFWNRRGHSIHVYCSNIFTRKLFYFSICVSYNLSAVCLWRYCENEKIWKSELAKRIINVHGVVSCKLDYLVSVGFTGTNLYIPRVDTNFMDLIVLDIGVPFLLQMAEREKRVSCKAVRGFW